MVSTKYIGASISTTNESGSNTAYTICLVDVKSTLNSPLNKPTILYSLVKSLDINAFPRC